MDIIIGAGVTGLSYANFTKNDYLIIEGENEPGGYCRTIKALVLLGITQVIFSTLRMNTLKTIFSKEWSIRKYSMLIK